MDSWGPFLSHLPREGEEEIVENSPTLFAFEPNSGGVLSPNVWATVFSLLEATTLPGRGFSRCFGALLVGFCLGKPV